MARIRSLKPEYFKDEDLATLPLEARLLYAGLWCFADREGHLEDRPKYLKAEIFPYDKVDVEKLLNLLGNPRIPERPEKVFIRRYTVNNRNYIDIPEFLKHQSPHHTERKSLIPAFKSQVTVNSPLEKGDEQDALLSSSYQESLSESLHEPKKKKIKYLDSVFLTDQEYQKLQEAMGQKNLDAGIRQLDYSITVKSGKYKDHYKTLINWCERGFIKVSSDNEVNNKHAGIKAWLNEKQGEVTNENGG